MRRAPAERVITTAVETTDTSTYKIEIVSATMHVCLKIMLKEILDLHRGQAQLNRRIVFP